MYITVAKPVTDADEAKYLEIMKLAGVGPTDDDYIAALVNGERGTGRKKGMGIGGNPDVYTNDDTDVDVDSNPDQLSRSGSRNPLELFAELRKLLAAKVSGHNNVYNSVVSILKKLMNMGEITKEKYDKLLHKYFKGW